MMTSSYLDDSAALVCRVWRHQRKLGLFKDGLEITLSGPATTRIIMTCDRYHFQ